jgi:hypothetical protein
LGEAGETSQTAAKETLTRHQQDRNKLKHGLIYLQGLTDEWGLVWRAGFRPDQVEFVGPKPVSQYDWKDFEYDGPKPTACYHWQYGKPRQSCPFPVQKKVKHDRLQFPI